MYAGLQIVSFKSNTKRIPLHPLCASGIYLAHLQPGLDDVCGRDERGRRHSGDGAGDEQREGRVVARLVGKARLQVRVCREVDGGEGNVAEEAGAGALKLRTG